VRVGTGGGSDQVTLFAAPTAEVGQLTIDTGDGEDNVLIDDHSATTEVNLGDGSDLVELRTSANGMITIDAGPAEDVINVIRVGDTTSTRLFGGDNADLFFVAGDNLPAGATTVIEGDDPVNMPGDVLRFDPGSVGATLNQAGDMQMGSIGVATMGQVGYSELEGFEVIAAPIISTPAAPTIAEGEALDLNVSVLPLGTGNSLDGPILWQLNGGVFGAVTGPNLNLTWDELRDNHGINDGDATYELAVRATNADGYTSTEVITLTVTNTAPTIDITASSDVSVNAPFAIDAMHRDAGDDSPRTWRIDWGDTTSDNYGAATSISGTHIYDEPGSYTVTVSLVDEDSDPGEAAINTHIVNVLVDPADISAGGPYLIEEGGALELGGATVGTPTAVGWDLNNDMDFSDAAGLTPSVIDWATLDALGINDSESWPISVQMTFANGQILTADTTIIVGNSDPSAILSNTAAVNGISEGASTGDVEVQFSSATDPASGDVAAGFTYSFDFDNDGVFDQMNTTGTAAVPAAIMGDQGRVTVRGRIADQDGGFRDYLTSFEVNEVLPSFTLAGDPTSVEGQAYVLDLLNLFDPGTGDALTGIDIDWGDGSPLESFDPTQTRFSHVFADNRPGATTIRVIATDADGSVEVTQDVNVSNVAPQLSAVTVAPLSGITPILEGDRVRLTGQLTDPGLLDTFTLEVDWGDGDTEAINLSEGTDAFELTHLYTTDGTFDILVTITDDDGGMDVDTPSVTVENAAPEIDLTLATAEIDENGEATLTGIIRDAGLRDTHTLTIDWRDGSPLQTVDATGGVFSASRTFTDDSPTGTPLDVFGIIVTATDAVDPTSFGTATIDLTVLNQAPQVIAVASDARDLAQAVLPGTPVAIEASFSDVGPDDTYEVELDWGDGNVDNSATISFDPITLLGTVQASHTYPLDGRYEVRVTLIDDDLGVSNTGTAFAVVATPGVNTTPVVDDQTFSIEENSAAGTSLGFVLGTDDDNGDVLRYRLDDSSVFTIDVLTGELTVADFATLDYEMNSSYSLQVTVTDPLGATDTATLSIHR
ncbi:MAG: PKD domain-containing protein, partial [Planctomycetota bacterium]